MRLLLHRSEVHGQQICQLENWPPTIFDTSFEGIGACPGPTITAFSDSGNAKEDSRLGRPLVTPGDTKVERVGATGRAELETVMADSGGNVGTNAGRVNVPEALKKHRHLYSHSERTLKKIKVVKPR